MKRFILYVLLLINLFFGLIYANYFEDITSGKDIFLQEGENIITGTNTNRIFICDNNTSSPCDKGNDNTYLDFSRVSYIISRNDRTPITITCKDGYIKEVNGYYLSLSYIWTGAIKELKISYGSYNRSSRSITYSGHITARCLNPLDPSEILVNNANINYQNTTIKSDTLDVLPITKNKEIVEDTDIDSKLVAGTGTEIQPSFVDVLFLQLKTISYLTDNIKLKKGSNFSFSGMFISQTDYDKYLNWIRKFSKYNNESEFLEAFTGNVALKDIGIAQDIIKGLYKCLNNNTCDKVISFAHDITNKFDFYSFTEIQSGVVLDIIPASINYYENLKSTCNNINNETNTFIKSNLEKLCNTLLTGQVSPELMPYFDLGYALDVRLKNLNKYKV